MQTSPDSAQAFPSITESEGVEADDFRAVFRGFPTGVAVITADIGEGPVGLTATSVSSVSVSPAMLVFSLSELSSSTPTIKAAETVVIHLLAQDQLHIAQLCATSGVDRFADTSLWSRLPTGEPYFPSARAWVRGRVVNRLDAGVATLVLVRAVDSDVRLDDNSSALVHHDRRWYGLGKHAQIAG